MMKKTLHISTAVALVALCMVAVLAFAGCTSTTVSKKSSEAALPANDVQQAENPDKYTEPFWVLVVGNDTRTGTIGISEAQYADGNARSDTMMLVRIDPTNYKVAIITLPRDTATYLYGDLYKINAAYEFGGMEMLQGEVTALTGVEPRYYLNMTFVQFENFINELGGITVDVPVDMSLQDIVQGDYIYLSAGEQQKLDGAEALVYARSRKNFSHDQDALRQNQDRAIVEAGIKFVAHNPSMAKLAVDAVLANSESNWDKDDLLMLVERFCDHAGQIEFVSGTGPYEGDMQDNDMWMTHRDEGTWHELIDVVENGGDPTDVVELAEIW